jgi:ubiquinone/menaquinone biosynthesis C-methylase UbiE
MTTPTSILPLPDEKLFSSYAEEHGWAEHAIRKEAVKGEKLKILEAGCGNLWFADLAGIDYHLVGVDSDRQALDIRLKQKKDLHEAIHGDLYEVPIEAGSFDVIYNSFVLEHVDHPEALLDRFKTWLKPGGLLILKIPDRKSVKGFLTAHTPHAIHVAYYRYYRGNPNAGKPGYMPYPTPFKRTVSRNGIHEWAEVSGMNVQDERGRWTTVDDSSFLFQTILKTVSVVTFGALTSRYSDVSFLIRKPT